MTIALHEVIQTAIKQKGVTNGKLGHMQTSFREIRIKVIVAEFVGGRIEDWFLTIPNENK